MIFSKEYDVAIRNTIRDKRFDIYSAKHQGLLVPGSLHKCLVVPPRVDSIGRMIRLPSVNYELSLETPYVIHPRRDLFRHSEDMNPKDLDSKVLKLFEKVKPVVKFYNDYEEIEGFTLGENTIKVNLTYHPMFKRDPTPIKKRSDVVSYMHFIETLRKMDSPPNDIFV